MGPNSFNALVRTRTEVAIWRRGYKVGDPETNAYSEDRSGKFSMRMNVSLSNETFGHYLVNALISNPRRTQERACR